MLFDKNIYNKLFKQCLNEERIKKSKELFKINLFLKKGENSLLIAKHIMEIKPGKNEPQKIYWDY